MQSLGMSMDNGRLSKGKAKSLSNSNFSSKMDKERRYMSAKKSRVHGEGLNKSLTSSSDQSSSSSFEKDPNASSEIAHLVKAAFAARNKMQRSTKLDTSQVSSSSDSLNSSSGLEASSEDCGDRAQGTQDPPTNEIESLILASAQYPGKKLFHK